MERVPPPVDLDALIAHREWVRRVACALVADRSAADDLEQDLWVKVIARPPRIRGSVRGWIAATLRNEFLNRRRGDARRVARESAVARAEGVRSTEDAVADADALRRVVNAVMELPEPYRSTVLLRYYEAVASSEIAARQGVPVETVRTRLKRAVAMLRQALDGGRGDRAAIALLLAPLLRPRHGVPTVPAGFAVAAFVGGALVTKKALAAAAVVALLAATASVLLSTEGDPRDSTRAAEPAPSAATATRDRPTRRHREDTAPAAAQVAATARAVVRGRVVDAAGTPVGGARVVSMTEDVGQPVLPDAGGPVREALAAPDGRFEAAVDPERPTHTLFVDAPAHSPETRTGVRAGDEVEIVLGARADLVGTVRDLDEQPVAGARVTWLVVRDLVRIEREAVSGVDGSYRVEGIARVANPADPQQYPVVRVAAEGFAPFQAEGHLAAADANGHLRFDVYLPRGATVRGRVLDAETSAPIAGARVVLWSVENVPALSADGNVRNPYASRGLGDTTTAIDGSFSLPRVPARGTVPVGLPWVDPDRPWLGFVQASAPGHARYAERISVPADGETVDYEMRLRPAASVRGRVVDEAGRAVAGARVFGYDPGRVGESWGTPDPYRRGADSGAVTAADGSYLLGAVGSSRHAPTSTTVSARAPGATPTTPSSTIAVATRSGETAQAPDIVVVTPSAAPAAAQAHPAAAATVPAAPAAQEPRGAVVEGVVVDASSGRRIVDSRVQLSGADGLLRARWTAPGRFTFGEVAPGEWNLSVRADGYVPAARRTVTVPEDGSVPPIEVRLERGVRVVGTVETADGTPLRGARVYFAAGAASVSGEVGQDGRLVVEGLRPAVDYRVKAASVNAAGDAVWWLPDDGPQRTIPAAGGEVREDLRLVRASALVVRIRSAHLPPAGRYDDATDEQKRVSRASRLALLDLNGVLTWEGGIHGESGIEEIFPAGNYLVRLTVPGREPLQKQVTLAPGGPTTTVEFDVP